MANHDLRHHNSLDRSIKAFDGLLRGLFSDTKAAARPSPSETLPEPPMSGPDVRHAAGLMRVNHAGEVCAQALYLGQALVARDEQIATQMRAAAAEERDHLVWCRQRLDELGSRPSRLDPAWFAGALAIGVTAAAISDRASLGFVEETERQVVAHLDGHLEQLPQSDTRSRAVIEQMRREEANHAARARASGAQDLPPMVRKIMALQARVMTRLAYWI